MDGSKVHTVVTHVGCIVTEIHMWLKIRSRMPGGRRGPPSLAAAPPPCSRACGQAPLTRGRRGGRTATGWTSAASSASTRARRRAVGRLSGLLVVATGLHSWRLISPPLPQVPLEPDADYDAVQEDGRGWHAAEAGLGWGVGGVRAHSRGLATFCFVPWEELETTELNSSSEEMDYYIAN